MKKLLLLTVCLVFIISSAHSVEDFTIWKVDANVQKFNDVYFAGQDDELIIIVCDSILYRMNSSNGNYIDSLYFGKRALSSAITNDGLKIYISLWDSIVGYDVYDLSRSFNIPKVSFSGRIKDDNTRSAYLKIYISDQDNYLYCLYDERNDVYENIYQILIFDIESNSLTHRFDNNTSVKNSVISYRESQMSPDEKTMIIYSEQNGEGELFFYDLEKKEFQNRIETKGKIFGLAEITFLSNIEVNITESELPSINGFNILDLNTNIIEDIFNFKSEDKRMSLKKSYRINENLLLLNLFSHTDNKTIFTFFNLEIKDTMSHLYNFQRGAEIDINELKTNLISYNGGSIYLHDLNKYLTKASVDGINQLYLINISPNPSNNRKFSLNITTDTIFNADINLYNINGQLEFNIIKNRIFTNGENVLEFSIPNELSSGQYYLKIESEGGSQDVQIQF